jgi:N-acetylglutamate synthase-like GNAT family acetyltransferase
VTQILSDGLYDVPKGKVATVVTHLEMREPAPPRPVSLPEGVTLGIVEIAEPAWYRDLFTRVGGQDWLWFSRLGLSDRALSRVLNDPAVELFVLNKSGHAEAMLELDFREEDTCELAFLGVTTNLFGTGCGSVLMNTAIAQAWARPIRRFHVHTCTLDHPAALGFYCRSGFIPYRQQIEIENDPRITGALPLDAGAHVPVFQ